MSVGYNSELTSANLNSAFASKTENNDLQGILALSNAASGNGITNVQQMINDINDSYVSKTNNSTITSIITLSNTSSGSSIGNLQQVVGDAVGNINTIQSDYVSKSNDSTINSQITLNHTDSGNQITDLQQEINDINSDIGLINTDYASKTNNNTLAGTQNISNSLTLSSISSSSIANVQDTMNDMLGDISALQIDIAAATSDLAWIMNTTEQISADGIITTSETINLQYRRIEGDGTSVTTNVLPFGNSLSWNDGIVIRLVCTSTNNVSFSSNDSQYGMILNGDCTLTKYNILTLQYDDTLERFLEIHRNF